VTSSLALVYLELGQPGLAEQTLVDVLNRSRPTLGDEHPMTLTAKHNLSDVYVRMGKNLKDATRLLTEVIESETKLGGRQHPETLRSLVKLGLLYANENQWDQAESLLSEALAGCRTALDRNHEVTDAALAGLAQVYAQKRDMTQLGRVLIEAAQITRARLGPDAPLTAAANQCAGMVLLIQRDYAQAEPYLRDWWASWVKGGPDREQRYLTELQYAVSLLAQKKYAEALPRLLAAYKGLRPGREPTRDLDQAELGWLLEQLTQLRDGNGHPLGETALAMLHRDPGLEAIVLDLQFPGDPFAP
jgi:tetratricopeptide (TPR) repeat protein